MLENDIMLYMVIILVLSSLDRGKLYISRPYEYHICFYFFLFFWSTKFLEYCPSGVTQNTVVCHICENDDIIVILITKFHIYVYLSIVIDHFAIREHA